MTKEEALKLTLEALEMNPLDTPTDVYDTKYQKAIDAAKEALAQPEQEPWKAERLESLRVQSDQPSLAAKQAYINGLEFELKAALAQPVQEPAFYTNKRGSQPVAPWGKSEDYCIPLYYAASPLPVQRQPLTDEQIDAISLRDGGVTYRQLARAVEAKLKEKNT